MNNRWKNHVVDPESRYISTASRGKKLLTREEEVALADRRDAGDRSARDELIERNLRLVIRIAKPFSDGIPGRLDELIGVGNLGLVAAADRFDQSRGYRFSTFASIYIKKAIFGYYGDHRRLVRLPRHIGMIVNKIRKERPLNADQARLAGMYGEAMMATVHRDCDIDMDDDHTMSFMDTLADHRERESPCDPDHLEWAKDAMKSLPEREREILRRRFGIGREEQTLKEIGDDMGVTRERVRQIQTNGLNRMAGRATDAMMCMFQKTLFPPNLCVEQARKRYRMDL